MKVDKTKILIMSYHGWCRAKRKTTMKYQERVMTECGSYVRGSFAFKSKGIVTCYQCQEIEHQKKGKP